MAYNNLQPYLVISETITLNGPFPVSDPLEADPEDYGALTLGMIRQFSFQYSFGGTALANGQFLPINQNQALFSLVGTSYGGDGQTTLALPDLRGAVSVGADGSVGVVAGQNGDISQAALPVQAGGEGASENGQLSLNVQYLIRTVAGQGTNTATMAGGIVQYAGSGVPVGYLVADGRTLAKADYPELYAAIGDTYGATAETFNLPDLVGRNVVGTGTAPGSSVTYQLGDTFGSDEPLTLANLPADMGGTATPIDNRAPGIALHFIIKMQGETVYPGDAPSSSNAALTGEIVIFAGDDIPAGWMVCDGSLVNISEYETLFNPIGTTYGGDGQSNFALPDLRGRVAIHHGHGPASVSTFQIGEQWGVETNTLTMADIPALDIHGTSGNDTYFGSNLADTIDGAGGSDTIDGNGGADSIFGGDGNDTIIVGAGDEIDGGDGTDVFIVHSAADLVGTTIDGGDGPFGDYTQDNLRLDTVGTYDLTIPTLTRIDGVELKDEDADESDTWSITLDDDTFDATGMYLGVFIYETAANSIIDASALTAGHVLNVFALDVTGNVTATGGLGDDTFTGGHGDDSFIGGDGDDVLNGNDGNDTLLGGDGADTISVGRGSDSVDAGAGNDMLSFGYGDEPDATDSFDGGSGNDTLYFDLANGPNDVSDAGQIFHNIERVLLYSYFQTVRFSANQFGAGLISSAMKIELDDGSVTQLRIAIDDAHNFSAHDWVFVTPPGMSSLYSFTAFINGTSAADTITGSEWQDSIDGGAGADIIYGGDGADIFIVGAGDTIDGGLQNDYFQIGAQADLVGVSLKGGDRYDSLVFTAIGTYDLKDVDLAGFEVLELKNGVNVTVSADQFDDIQFSNAFYITLTGTGSGTVRVEDASNFSAAGWTKWVGNIAIHIIGTTSDDSITGSGENDTIAGGLGDDAINGGGGTDTYLFLGALANFDISYDAGTQTFTVTDLVGLQGTDTLVNIEYFEFSGATLAAADAIPTAPVIAADLTNATALEEAGFGVAGVASASGDLMGGVTDINTVFGDSVHFEAARSLNLGVSFVTISGASTSYQGKYGVLVVNSDGTYAYQLSDSDSDTNELADGEAVTEVFEFKVADEDGHTATAQLTFNITGSNDAPVISSVDHASVAENSSAFSFTVSAADAEGDAFTYSISGTDAAFFKINANTGLIELNAPLDFETKADANHDGVYSFTVKIAEVGTPSVFTTQTVSVTVTDVNEAPMITSNGSGSTASIGVSENTTAVTTVTSTDPEGTARTYSIQGGADAGLFSIDGATGVLVFNSTPNREAPADANHDNVYEVIVRASDGSLTDTQTLSITVGNINEPPVITSNGGGANAALTISENTTAVTTVVVADPEGGITYSLSGADAARFTISTSGVLAFITAPDREAPQDANLNNIYDVIVTASDGTNSAAQALAVTVANVNEAPTFGSAPTSVTVTENLTTVGSYAAIDVEGASLTYTLTGTDAALFAINSAGVLTFRSAPDREAPADANHDNIYQVTVNASDGPLTTSRAVSVTVGNQDEAPVITSNGGAPLARSINENTAAGTQVAAITAVDPEGASITYAFVGMDSQLFDIDTATGIITLKHEPDFEAPVDLDGNNVYSFIVVASDGSWTDTQTVTVTVKDVNGNTIAANDKANRIDTTHKFSGKGATGEEDKIDGKGGDDTLNGGNGNDTLIGGSGKDSLTGNAGADKFVFNAKLGTTNIDTVTDFRHDVDQVQLDDKIFSKIGASLSAGEFYAKAGATKAHDGSDRIVYDTKTGKLYYDDDGKGGHAAVQFAVLSGHPTLDHGDFAIV